MAKYCHFRMKATPYENERIPIFFFFLASSGQIESLPPRRLNRGRLDRFERYGRNTTISERHYFNSQSGGLLLRRAPDSPWTDEGQWLVIRGDQRIPGRQIRINYLEGFRGLVN